MLKQSTVIADVLSPSVSASWNPTQPSTHTHTPHEDDTKDLTRKSSPSKSCTIRSDSHDDITRQYDGNSNRNSPTKNTSNATKSHNSSNYSVLSRRDDSGDTKVKKSDSVGDRIVVSFRGSILANLMTDLTMTQVPIPRLKYRRKFFVKMIQDLDLNDSGEENDGGKNVPYHIDRKGSRYSAKKDVSDLKSPDVIEKDTADEMELKLNRVIDRASQKTVIRGKSDEVAQDLVSGYARNASVTSFKTFISDNISDSRSAGPGYTTESPPISSKSTSLSISSPYHSRVSSTPRAPYSPFGASTGSLVSSTKITSPTHSLQRSNDELSQKFDIEVHNFDSMSLPHQARAAVQGTQLLKCCIGDDSNSAEKETKRSNSRFGSYFNADDGDGEGGGAADNDCDSSRGSSYMDLEAQILQYNTSEKIGVGHDVGDYERRAESRQKLLQKDSSKTQDEEDDNVLEGRYRTIPLGADEDGLSGVEGRGAEKRIVESSWFTCLRSVLSSLPVFQHTLPRIHEGFWGAYSSVRTDVLRSIVRAFCYHKKEHQRVANILACNSDNMLGIGAGIGRKNLNRSQHPILSPLQVKNITNDLSRPLRVCFCGHSLGAALTVLAALDLSVNLNYILDAIETVYGEADDSSNEAKTKIKEKSPLNDIQESSKNSVKKLFTIYNAHPQHSNTSTPSSKSKRNSQQSTDINSVELTSFYTEKEDTGGSIKGPGQGSREGSSALKIRAECRKASKWESPTIAVYTYGGTELHCTVLYCTVRYSILGSIPSFLNRPQDLCLTFLYSRNG